MITSRIGNRQVIGMTINQLGYRIALGQDGPEMRTFCI